MKSALKTRFPGSLAAAAGLIWAGAALLVFSAGRLAAAIDHVPFYFAVPDSSHLDIDPASPAAARFKLVRVPGYEARPVGLRIIAAGEAARDRPALSKALVEAGLLRDGDVILTFHPEWEGTTAYQHLQMGISHSGTVFIHEGAAYNLDMPLDLDFVGDLGASALESAHYMDAPAVHIVRPRDFDDARAANLRGWARLIQTNLARIREEHMLPFSVSYISPKAAEDPNLAFVSKFARIIRGDEEDGVSVHLFCSEFVWSLLSLSGCDPAGHAVPDLSCIRPILPPMEAFSSPEAGPLEDRALGYAEGPLLALKALGAPPEEEKALLDALFSEGNIEGASFGHRLAAGKVKPIIDLAAGYYRAVAAGEAELRVPAGEGGTEAISLAEFIARSRKALKPNYPPAGFLVNSFAPRDSPARVFDYVGTLVFE